MKTIIGFFAIAFLVFGFIGFSAGHKAASASDFVQEVCLKRLNLVVRRETPSIKGAAELVYQENGKVFYRFDVESNTLKKTPDAAAMSLEPAFQSGLKFPIDDDLLLAVVGGSGAGFKAKDLFALQEVKSYRAATAGISH